MKKANSFKYWPKVLLALFIKTLFLKYMYQTFRALLCTGWEPNGTVNNVLWNR